MHSTVFAYSALWSIFSFSVNSNLSHNCIMVKDKHAKALNFMESMKLWLHWLCC